MFRHVFTVRRGMRRGRRTLVRRFFPALPLVGAGPRVGLTQPGVNPAIPTPGTSLPAKSWQVQVVRPVSARQRERSSASELIAGSTDQDQKRVGVPRAGA